MTNYRLFPSTNGPGAVTAFSGAFQAGVAFRVTSYVWLNGFYYWVSPGGDTTARTFALWQIEAGSVTSAPGALVVAGTAVTSGTLTANAWNYVPLSAPVQLSPNLAYEAVAGWTATNGFSETINQFGASQPLAGGITNGPLRAYSDTGGTDRIPTGYYSTNWPQGQFGTGGTSGGSGAANVAATGDRSANFWMDVQVTDSAPSNPTYRLFPSNPDPVDYALDTAHNFTLANEFKLSQPCVVNKIWFYSPPTVTQLPTETAIYNQSTQAIVAGTHLTSPTWSGAAGSGWVSVTYTGLTLPAGSYRVAVFNGAASPAIWNAASQLYWDSGQTLPAGAGGSGLSNGPLSAPGNSTADTPGGTGSYHQGTIIAWPDTVSSPVSNYWVDIEVSIAGETGAFNITLPAPKTTLNAVVLAPGESGPLFIAVPAPKLPSLTGVVVHQGAFNLTLPVILMPLTGAVPGGEQGPFNITLPSPFTLLTATNPVRATQYVVVENAPNGIGTLTPILIDPTLVTWDWPHAEKPPKWAPCWIVWNTAHNVFKGIGWHTVMPMYIVPAAVELGGQNVATPPQPTLL